MKKILFATTALVATAGIASADVSLTGYAEIGVIGGNDAAGVLNNINSTQYHSDMDVSFHLSGQSDNGLSFGAKIDLDEVSTGIPAGHNNTFTNATVWVSGSFGKITLGDTDGAYDWALQEIGMGTSLTDDHTTHAGYNFNSGFDSAYGGQVLRYDNTFGNFGVALSANIDDTGTGSTVWGLGLKYNTDFSGTKVGFGLGYQDNGTNTLIGLSVDAKMANGFRAIVNYSDQDSVVTHGAAMDYYVGVGVGYTSGPLLVTANYGEFKSVAANSSASGYGLAVNYDLGGGAVVMAGYGNSQYDAGNANAAGDGTNSWSLGLGLSF